MVKRRIGIALIGHGVPATDCPPRLVGELMGLLWRNGQGHDEGEGALADRIRQLDDQIRDWPRRPDNDPYKAGLERLAGRLKPLLPRGLFVIGYNEFCRPSVPEALEQLISRGAEQILVIPSMLTPGGVHSERDIPRAIEQVRRAHPGVVIEYLWPYDLGRVAGLLAGQVRQALTGSTTRRRKPASSGAGRRPTARRPRRR